MVNGRNGARFLCVTAHAHFPSQMSMLYRVLNRDLVLVIKTMETRVSEPHRNKEFVMHRVTRSIALRILFRYYTTPRRLIEPLKHGGLSTLVTSRM